MMKASTVQLGVVLAGALVLGACATSPSNDQAPSQTRSVGLSDGSVRADTSDERLAELWSLAERDYRVGNDVASLERLYEGLDIDPRNSLFWSRAAEIQLRNAEPAQAENYAVKSNSFAADNAQLLYRNWLIIETARDMRGDLLGVRSAHKKVQQYQYR